MNKFTESETNVKDFSSAVDLMLILLLFLFLNIEFKTKNRSFQGNESTTYFTFI